MHLIWWWFGEPTRQHFPMEARFVQTNATRRSLFFCTDKMVVARHYSRLTDRWEWCGVEICFGVSGRFCGSWAELRTGDRKEADRVLEPRRLTARIYRSVTVHRCVVLNHYYQPIITSTSHSTFSFTVYFVANKIWCFIKGEKTSNT
jgi:hypothetical protein